MSIVYVNCRSGHPLLGFLVGLLGISVALLLSLVFGVIAGAVAGFLGLIALLMGFSARRYSHRGFGAILAGILAIVLAFSMTLTSIDTIKNLKETAAASGMAPTFTRYMNEPHLGLFSAVANAANDKNNQDAVNTLQKELDALSKYVANTEKTNEKNASAAS